MQCRVPNEAVADVHRHLAKEAAAAANSKYGSSASSIAHESIHMARSASEKVLSSNEDAARLKTPGGFRRHFLNERATDRGIPPEDRPKAWQQNFFESLRPLSRVGHFESVLGISLNPDTGEDQPLSEGQSSTTQAAIAIVKSFIGSGVTFLPNAFALGGWLFSSLAMLTIAAASLLCIRLLLDCRSRANSSNYGEIARMASGDMGRIAVQLSLVLSQFGICIAFFIFIGRLAQSMDLVYGTRAIFYQLAVVVPLCLIRSVRHLEVPNLLADALIMFGLGVVLYYDFRALAVRGIISDVVSFRPHSCGLTIGTMIYVFEGIPMILPIRSSMREPDKFWHLFSKLFVGITLFFLMFGLFCYGRLGSHADTVVLLNLPPDLLTFNVKISYMVALLLSLPLMFLPAARITELWVFGILHKEQFLLSRGIMRAIQVCALAIVAMAGGQYFDEVLALIGAFCAAPVAFIYPALFHLRLCAETRLMKILDLSMALFGVACMVATLRFLC